MSKIEWTDITWNPVWGCLTGCPYCYAKRIASRFFARMAKKDLEYRDIPVGFTFEGVYNSAQLEEQLQDFQPTWLESNFQKKFPKKPKRIFVNSMSDIHWWETEWMERVLDQIKEYPQHTFMFLTKFPKTYIKYDFPQNCWLGFTATNRDQLNNVEIILLAHNHYFLGRVTFLSVEPIQERMWSHSYKYFKWVIIGAETGHRPEKAVPSVHWIEDIELYCQKHKIPLFMKDNLNKDPNFYGDLIQQFPKEELNV